MTKIERRVKSALADRGLKIVDLSELTGFALSTIYRALKSETKASRQVNRTRQAITNICRSEVFRGMFPMRGNAIIAVGTEIEIPDDDQASDLESEFGAFITRKSRRTFVFVRPASITIN
jgi:hypothetical protein